MQTIELKKLNVKNDMNKSSWKINFFNWIYFTFDLNPQYCIMAVNKTVGNISTISY